MATHRFDYDLIVIGSGAGGSAAATIAAKAGKKVAIIERDAFGGDSPNWSDVPTKALLHTAQLFDEARRGSVFGLRTATLGYNYPSIRDWKDLAVRRTGAGGSRKFYENNGINAYHGNAHFLSPHEISVNRRHLSAKHFLIATGSHWVTPAIQGLDALPFYTPRTILETLKPPKSICIIGGGSHAVEIAELLSIFGTDVTIIEKASRLLPDLDAEIGEQVEHHLTKTRGVTVLTHANVMAVEKDGLKKRVVLKQAGVDKHLKIDDILVAAGRIASVDLGLENATVRYTPKGIDVDQHLQTNVKHIYAAGDVIGRHHNTHSALLESRVVAHNLLHKNPITPDYTATPTIIFTAPEIAVVGLSEDDCHKRDIAYKKAIAPLNIIARSNTSNFHDGFVKLIVDKKGVVLGGAIVAPHAGDMIHEIGLAVKHQLTAQMLADTPHGFLTWAEAIRVAASKLS